MSDQHGTEPQMPDFDKLAENMSSVAEKSQRLIADFMKRQAEGEASGFDDPMHIGHTFLELTQKMMADPA